jgi:hypothetical protein
VAYLRDVEGFSAAIIWDRVTEFASARGITIPLGVRQQVFGPALRGEGRICAHDVIPSGDEEVRVDGKIMNVNQVNFFRGSITWITSSDELCLVILPMTPMSKSSCAKIQMTKQACPTSLPFTLSNWISLELVCNTTPELLPFWARVALGTANFGLLRA